MKLHLVRHLWGVDISEGLSQYFPKWRKTGYEILEVGLLRVPDLAVFHEARKAEGLAWIPQVFSNMFAPGGSVKEHWLSLKEQVEECLGGDPLFINAHSGSDAWVLEEALEFYGRIAEMQEEFGVIVAHETHRSRYFGSPWNTRYILDRIPDLQLTCDFSHWVCVAERLLQDCQEILEQAAEHCLHVHARVGYEQGPQVPDPRAPEWSTHLQVHEEWWDMIWRAQNKRDFASSTLTPEFGPPPYMQTVPYTQERLGDLEGICDWMALRQAKRFAQIAGNK